MSITSSLGIMDFWKMPMAAGEFDMADDDKALARKLAEQKQSSEARPVAVQWPPARPADLETEDTSAARLLAAKSGASGDASGGASSTGRGNRRRGGKGDKPEGAGATASSPEKGSPPSSAEKSSGKRDDGWLPKAEYEAKKREERARRQREKQQAGSSGEQSHGGGGGGGKGQGGKDEKSKEEEGQRKGRGGWGANRDGWQDVMMTMPKRPPPVEETADVKAARATEEAKLHARDVLRAASTAEELRKAVVVAREAGLVQEVQVAERKLAKMEAA